jgi:ATPase family protein associated with various cellular activities (AAA)
MTDLSSRLRVLTSLEQDSPATAFFYSRLIEDQLAEVHTDRWATSARSLAEVGKPLFRVVAPEQETVVAQHETALLNVTMYSGYVHAQAAGETSADCEAALERLRGLLPAPEPVARHDVPVTFWTYTPNGPMPSMRAIAVPGWLEIRENYTAETRQELERIMSGFRPSHGGQLILWHGDAGTGKTFALRALAWEWREWCQIHYIVDPDTFFGQRADYLMTVLTQPNEMAARLHMMRAYHGFGSGSFQQVVHTVDGEDDGDPDGSKHWRLLVLEDTGELLTPDAKSIIGQGLSRFLNVVDGLIGQGLRVLVLVTTNEELRRLHPAVARPGRCAANIEFEPLGADEAGAWLESHGVEGDAGGRRILASLYAELEGLDPDNPQRGVGFAD